MHRECGLNVYDCFIEADIHQKMDLSRTCKKYNYEITNPIHVQLSLDGLIVFDVNLI